MKRVATILAAAAVPALLTGCTKKEKTNDDSGAGGKVAVPNGDAPGSPTNNRAVANPLPNSRPGAGGKVVDPNSGAPGAPINDRSVAKPSLKLVPGAGGADAGKPDASQGFPNRNPPSTDGSSEQTSQSNESDGGDGEKSLDDVASDDSQTIPLEDKLVHLKNSDDEDLKLKKTWYNDIVTRWVSFLNEHPNDPNAEIVRLIFQNPQFHSNVHAEFEKERWRRSIYNSLALSTNFNKILTFLIQCPDGPLKTHVLEVVQNGNLPSAEIMKIVALTASLNYFKQFSETSFGGTLFTEKAETLLAELETIFKSTDEPGAFEVIKSEIKALRTADDVMNPIGGDPVQRLLASMSNESPEELKAWHSLLTAVERNEWPEKDIMKLSSIDAPIQFFPYPTEWEDKKRQFLDLLLGVAGMYIDLEQKSSVDAAKMLDELDAKNRYAAIESSIEQNTLSSTLERITAEVEEIRANYEKVVRGEGGSAGGAPNSSTDGASGPSGSATSGKVPDEANGNPSSSVHSRLNGSSNGTAPSSPKSSSSSSSADDATLETNDVSVGECPQVTVDAGNSEELQKRTVEYNKNMRKHFEYMKMMQGYPKFLDEQSMYVVQVHKEAEAAFAGDVHAADLGGLESGLQKDLKKDVAIVRCILYLKHGEVEKIKGDILDEFKEGKVPDFSDKPNKNLSPVRTWFRRFGMYIEKLMDYRVEADSLTQELPAALFTEKQNIFLQFDESLKAAAKVGLSDVKKLDQLSSDLQGALDRLRNRSA